MRKIVNVLVIVPLALVLLAFAVANRQFVTVSFNPFDASDAALALMLPLFVVIFVAAALGVIAGSLATWFGQRRWRRAARQNEAEAREARQQLLELRSRAPAGAQGGFRSGFRTAPAADQPGPRPSDAAPGAPRLAIGRDKPGTTL